MKPSDSLQRTKQVNDTDFIANGRLWLRGKLAHQSFGINLSAAIVYKLPFTTLVVIPAVDGICAAAAVSVRVVSVVTL